VAKEQTFVVEAVAVAMEKLASGDLTYRLDANFSEEYRRLKENFNVAVDQMRAAIASIATNSDGIRSGAGEISQATRDLSGRTEQQAATLEQTAAALEQITTTVRKTAAGAERANGQVQAATTDAEKSGHVVRQAIDAMSGIEQSAQQISQIIGVIDEIAFQTNLLALNAGVEAARAGEAGRGFAVVAQEVRALAQRSAEAAKEIKTLILTSSDQVESGVALVGQTGEALERIVVEVAEISALVSEITASAQEESRALAEVSTAINQMDQTTQQNAAMVQQTSGASQSLAHDSEELSRLVARFQIGAAINRPAASTPHETAAPERMRRVAGARG
jgi:methyl-accepting chemotaxis protein